MAPDHFWSLVRYEMKRYLTFLRICLIRAAIAGLHFSSCLPGMEEIQPQMRIPTILSCILAFIISPKHKEMKRFYLLMLLTCLLCLPQTFYAAVAASNGVITPAEAVQASRAEWNNMSRKEKKMARKSMKKKIKTAIKDWKKSGSDDTDTLLLVLITILLPPLGMYLYEDAVTNRFWISLLLTLLFYLPGLIYTLVVILGGK